MRRNRALLLLAGAGIALVGAFLGLKAATSESTPSVASQGDHPSPNGEIFVMNADGSGQTNLTTSSRDEAAPAWSPDGRKIAFVVSDATAENEDIWLMNADGSGQRNLTRSLGSQRNKPAWSPDGTRIAFSSARTPPSWSDEILPRHIFLMNADGSAERKVTNSLDSDYNPVWSPNGREIAFLRNEDIFVMNADGSVQTNLSNVSDPRDDWAEESLAWSPDGGAFAFTRFPLAGYALRNIWLMNADGARARRLTKRAHATDGVIHSLAWSPDGQQIAFVEDVHEKTDIFVMDADGSEQRNLTNSPFFEDAPSWSPDGQKIAFQTYR